MIAFLYLMGITVAELVTFFVSAAVGIAFHMIILFSLIFHSSFTARYPSHKLYLSLSIAPLIRIVSLSMPLSQFSQIYGYVFTAIPLLIAVLTIIIVLNYKPLDINLTLRKMPVQGLVALTGIGFGLAEYHILGPEPLISTLTLGKVLLPSFIFLITTGIVEELAFRGVMQRAALQTLGPWGWVYVAAVYSVLHVGYQSATYWLLALLVGLFFGWIVKRTGSLLGVILAHCIINICSYLVIPFIV